MAAPLVIQISDLRTLPEEQLVGRLRGAAALPADTRRRIAVELRDPQATTRELLELGHRLRRLTRELGQLLLVNDRLDLAQALEADGVHLGRYSVSVADARRLLGADLWVSVSCHDIADVVRARADEASAAVLSPIFDSPGKGEPLGIDVLERVRAALGADSGVWIYALGGVTPERAAACLAAGAHGVAAIRADLIAALPALAACALRRLGRGVT